MLPLVAGVIVSGSWVDSEKRALWGRTSQREGRFALVQKKEEGEGRGWVGIDLPVSMETFRQQPPFVLNPCQMASPRFAGNCFQVGCSS